jgi:hypothetical protein
MRNAFPCPHAPPSAHHFSHLSLVEYHNCTKQLVQVRDPAKQGLRGLISCTYGYYYANPAALLPAQSVRGSLTSVALASQDFYSPGPSWERSRQCQFSCTSACQTVLGSFATNLIAMPRSAFPCAEHSIFRTISLGIIRYLTSQAERLPRVTPYFLHPSSLLPAMHHALVSDAFDYSINDRLRLAYIHRDDIAHR